jgi:hypothetical protein
MGSNEHGQRTLEFRVADLAKAEEVFAKVRQIKGVADVRLLMQGAKHPLMRTQAVASLDGAVEAAQVRARLADIPGVLDCEVSPQRYLK